MLFKYCLCTYVTNWCELLTSSNLSVIQLVLVAHWNCADELKDSYDTVASWPNKRCCTI